MIIHLCLYLCIQLFACIHFLQPPLALTGTPASLCKRIFLKHLLFITASKAAGLYLKQAFVIISMWLVYAVYVSSTRQTLVFQHYAVNTNSTVRCPFQIKSPLMFLCIQQTRQFSCTCFPDCIICIGLFTCKISIHCSPIIMCVALKVSVVRFVLFDLKKKEEKNEWHLSTFSSIYSVFKTS